MNIRGGHGLPDALQVGQALGIAQLLDVTAVYSFNLGKCGVRRVEYALRSLERPQQSVLTERTQTGGVERQPGVQALHGTTPRPS